LKNLFYIGKKMNGLEFEKWYSIQELSDASGVPPKKIKARLYYCSDARNNAELVREEHLKKPKGNRKNEFILTLRNAQLETFQDYLKNKYLARKLPSITGYSERAAAWV